MIADESSGLSVFRRLIAPITVEDFFNHYWEKKTLYIPRNDPHYYDDILTFADVDQYLSRTDLRYPYIRLVQEGRELPLNTYAVDSVFGENVFQGNLNLDKLFHFYHEGATMCMQLQHLALPKLRRFTNQLESFFEFRTQSTLFLTPPGSQGFTAHFDSHDFFIFQIHGKKQWRIYPDSVELPLARNRVLDSEVNVGSPPNFEPLIQPGDCLYVPRGVFHEALTTEGSSLQISLGVFPYLWCDVLHKMIDDLANSESAFRRSASIPTVTESGRLSSDFRNLLSLLESASPEKTVSEMKRKSLAHQTKECSGRLMDLERIAKISNKTSFQKREIFTELKNSEEEIEVFFYDKGVVFPDFVSHELEYILKGDVFTIEELPGILDEASRLVLLEKLVAEGLVRIV